jgi:diguanylate cyclase (GGDEF)-like protein
MKFSLNKKATLLIICLAAIISLLAIIIYNRGIHNVIESQYGARSVDIAKLVAVELDQQQVGNIQQAVLGIYDNSNNKVMSDKWGTPEFEEYVSQYSSVTETEDYKAVLADLRRMQDVLDVDCLYIIWADVPNECYVYLVDAAYEGQCPTGCIDPIYFDDPTEQLKDLESAFKPNITNTPEYGWLMSTAAAIYDGKGEIIAFATVDLSMNEIMARQRRFVIYVALAFLAVTILVCLIGILAVNRVIVNPINKLSAAAAQYKNNRKAFSELNISRNDEIGSLADSMVQMEEDIDGYINNLEQTTKDLISARNHAEQMDQAANVDPLTKVRNKRSYDIESERLNESTSPYGIVMIDLNGLKSINDNYGHEKGDVSIKTLCQIVCRVFKHSPVYRVGGDEFVVILENDDFEERDTLIQSIKDIFTQNAGDTSLQPWERVTAAVGCAVCDHETDENVERVLQRADTAMYENKKTMKETL